MDVGELLVGVMDVGVVLIVVVGFEEEGGVGEEF